MLKRHIFVFSELDGSQLLTADGLKHGWKLFRTRDENDAHKMFASQPFFAGIIDFSVAPATQLLALHDELVALNPSASWVALVPSVLLENDKFCEQLDGRFFDYHKLPHDPERLLIMLGHAYGMAILNPAHRRVAAQPNPYGMIGDSAVMKLLYKSIHKAAAVDDPLLIVGESGTGKELVAGAIHRHSSRKDRPFIAANCASLPSALVLSELFGHERGAFPGAVETKVGCFEAADGGTVVLNDIEELSAEVQALLLRLLQDRVIRRSGSDHDRPVDVRVVAATSTNLERAITERRFRQDLYYRINVLRLNLPPLRDRFNDVILLANHLLTKFKGDGRRITGFTSPAVEAMIRHDWPGNVRELSNRIRRAVIMCEDRLITPMDLGFSNPTLRNHHIMDLNEARLIAERNAIQTALWHSGNNFSLAAKYLKVSRMTLYRLMDKVGISYEAPEAADEDEANRHDGGSHDATAPDIYH